MALIRKKQHILKYFWTTITQTKANLSHSKTWSTWDAVEEETTNIETFPFIQYTPRAIASWGSSPINLKLHHLHWLQAGPQMELVPVLWAFLPFNMERNGISQNPNQYPPPGKREELQH